MLRRRAIALVAVVVMSALVAVASWLYERMTSWPARRALPRGAVVLSENAQITPVLGDYFYDLTARMTPDEFAEWMRRLDLAPCGYESAPLRWRGPVAPDHDEWGSGAVYDDGVGRFHSWSY
jgi:hypothetical protein